MHATRFAYNLMGGDCVIGGPAKSLAGLHVELAAVSWTRDHTAIDHSGRQLRTGVRAHVFDHTDASLDVVDRDGTEG